MRSVFARARAAAGIAAVAALVGLAAGAPPAEAKKKKPRGAVRIPKDRDPDCLRGCAQKQRDCMFECARVTGDAEHEQCVDDCVKAYVRCAKACPPRR